jgi:flagellar basal-body rod protein FlgC
MSSAVTGIAVTAMDSASRRLAAAASNIANAYTSGRKPATPPSEPIPGQGAGRPYQAIDAVSVSLGAPGGVRSDYIPRTPSYVLAADPDSPDADEKGLVAAPNVDDAAEIVSTIEARTAYATAVKVVQAEDEMTRRLLDATA